MSSLGSVGVGAYHRDLVSSSVETEVASGRSRSTHVGDVSWYTVSLYWNGGSCSFLDVSTSVDQKQIVIGGSECR